MAFDPIATKVLVGLNVAAFVVATAWGGQLFRLSGRPFQEGALFGPLIDQGEWYRVFTSAFLHDGLMHLGFNMWALWLLGGQLERVFKPSRYALLYLASLIGGSFGALLLDPTTAAVGASGAVFGVFGATAVIQRSVGLSVWASGLGPILGINLLLTFLVPQISIGGHLGGLLVGAGVGSVYVAAVRSRKPESWAVAVAGVVSAILFLGCLWAASQWTDPIF
ncbi:MAG: rhomboid family intramembrane serine protease, partial [Actinomycetia bacterium]|nr:rhomboid family intramembrane serine protease [Actinomycetes bacterium]